MSEPEVGDTDDWETGSAGSAEFDLDPDADEEPAFEATFAPEDTAEPPQPAWVHHLLDEGLKGWDSANSRHEGSQNLRKEIAASGDLVDRAKATLSAISAHGLDLPTFLYAISASKDLTLANARGFLLGHPDFPVIIESFDRHSIRTIRQRKKKKDEPKPVNTVLKAATECVKRHIERELRALAPVMKMNAWDVSPEALLSIDMKTMMEDTYRLSPVLWDVMTHTAYTRRQSQRNKYKSPDNVSRH
jgi:hypothetical protein